MGVEDRGLKGSGARHSILIEKIECLKGSGARHSILIETIGCQAIDHGC